MCICQGHQVYIYKGHDCTTLGVGEDIDEILEDIGFCYISPSEAFWHIAEFPMHGEKPSVYYLLTFHISRLSILVMMMIWTRLWSAMP